MWWYWMVKLMQLWTKLLESEVLKLQCIVKTVRNYVFESWCHWIRKASVDRYQKSDMTVCIAGKISNAKIVTISPWLALYTKILPRITFPNSCTIKRSCWSHPASVSLCLNPVGHLWDITSTARVPTELSPSHLWVKIKLLKPLLGRQSRLLPTF